MSALSATPRSVRKRGLADLGSPNLLSPRGPAAPPGKPSAPRSASGARSSFEIYEDGVENVGAREARAGVPVEFASPVGAARRAKGRSLFLSPKSGKTTPSKGERGHAARSSGAIAPASSASAASLVEDKIAMSAIPESDDASTVPAEVPESLSAQLEGCAESETLASVPASVESAASSLLPTPASSDSAAPSSDSTAASSDSAAPSSDSAAPSSDSAAASSDSAAASSDSAAASSTDTTTESASLALAAAPSPLAPVASSATPVRALDLELRLRAEFEPQIAALRAELDAARRELLRRDESESTAMHQQWEWRVSQASAAAVTIASEKAKKEQQRANEARRQLHSVQEALERARTENAALSEAVARARRGEEAAEKACRRWREEALELRAHRAATTLFREETPTNATNRTTTTTVTMTATTIATAAASDTTASLGAARSFASPPHPHPHLHPDAATADISSARSLESISLDSPVRSADLRSTTRQTPENEGRWEGSREEEEEKEKAKDYTAVVGLPAGSPADAVLVATRAASGLSTVVARPAHDSMRQTSTLGALEAASAPASFSSSSLSSSSASASSSASGPPEAGASSSATQSSEAHKSSGWFPWRSKGPQTTSASSGALTGISVNASAAAAGAVSGSGSISGSTSGSTSGSASGMGSSSTIVSHTLHGGATGTHRGARRTLEQEALEAAQFTLAAVYEQMIDASRDADSLRERLREAREAESRAWGAQEEATQARTALATEIRALSAELSEVTASRDAGWERLHVVLAEGRSLTTRLSNAVRERRAAFDELGSWVEDSEQLLTVLDRVRCRVAAIASGSDPRPRPSPSEEATSEEPASEKPASEKPASEKPASEVQGVSAESGPLVMARSTREAALMAPADLPRRVLDAVLPWANECRSLLRRLLARCEGLRTCLATSSSDDAATLDSWADEEAEATLAAARMTAARELARASRLEDDLTRAQDEAADLRREMLQARELLVEFRARLDADEARHARERDEWAMSRQLLEDERAVLAEARLAAEEETRALAMAAVATSATAGAAASTAVVGTTGTNGLPAASSQRAFSFSTPPTPFTADSPALRPYSAASAMDAFTPVRLFQIGRSSLAIAAEAASPATSPLASPFSFHGSRASQEPRTPRVAAFSASGSPLVSSSSSSSSSPTGSFAVTSESPAFLTSPASTASPASASDQPSSPASPTPASADERNDATSSSPGTPGTPLITALTHHNAASETGPTAPFSTPNAAPETAPLPSPLSLPGKIRRRVWLLSSLARSALHLSSEALNFGSPTSRTAWEILRERLVHDSERLRAGGAVDAEDSTGNVDDAIDAIDAMETTERVDAVTAALSRMGVGAEAESADDRGIPAFRLGSPTARPLSAPPAPSASASSASGFFVPPLPSLPEGFLDRVHAEEAAFRASQSADARARHALSVSTDALLHHWRVTFFSPSAERSMAVTRGGKKVRNDLAVRGYAPRRRR